MTDNYDNPPCVTCGCTGNQSCGHEPLDEDMLCALWPDGVCGCCKVKEKNNHFQEDGG